MPGDLDLTNATETTPKDAPVSEPEPLTGKEKAGVSLTWGVIWVLVSFVVFILLIFIWGESHFFDAIEDLQKIADSTAPPSKDILIEISSLSRSLESERDAFRIFWFDTLQLILLNVLFPTLTALLGYVFGTSRSNNA